MPQPQSEAPDLRLERARDRVGSSKTAWCANYWRGERLVQGWWWRGSQKSNKPSKLPEIYKNGKKTGSFAHVLVNKSPKTSFFAHNYLTRYTHEMLFEEYMNFETHYLSSCRVIPLQSFRSHIRPRPHGLGLMLNFMVIQHVYARMQFVNLCTTIRGRSSYLSTNAFRSINLILSLGS